VFIRNQYNACTSILFYVTFICTMFYSSIRAIIILVFLLSFVLDAAATSGLWKHTVSRLRWKRNKVSHTVSELRRKRSGISNIAPRNDPVNTQDNCTHGPTTRGCWSEGLSIDTNPDLYWPETGKTIIVSTEFSCSLSSLLMLTELSSSMTSRLRTQH
jgi:hypothetical protein